MGKQTAQALKTIVIYVPRDMHKATSSVKLFAPGLDPTV